MILNATYKHIENNLVDMFIYMLYNENDFENHESAG